MAANYLDIPFQGGGGGTASPLTVVSTVTGGAYAANPGELIPVSLTLGGCSVNLPDSPPDQSRVVVKLKGAAAAHQCTVSCSGGNTIDWSGSSVHLSFDDEWLDLLYIAADLTWLQIG